ncbi:MAG: DUF1080 domain-containing protein [Parafilimonas sp.]|nr:DUF1080 domain-containing protein [Parafilimonas sp.]
MNQKSFSLIIIAIACLCLNIASAQNNTLTEQEKQEGWKLLFNGKDLTGWHSYLQKKSANGWKVEDESIYINEDDKTADNTDLITDEEFENFDLKLQFKTDTCANSGVMFYVHEDPKYGNTWETGPEMQIDDVVCGPDHLSKMNRMGTLYDLYPVDSEYVGASGNWYEYEIKADHGHLQLFEDGHKIVDAQMWTQNWKDLIAAVKFKDMPGFGTFHQGHIAFQGTENGKIWFRNIKIKAL